MNNTYRIFIDPNEDTLPTDFSWQEGLGCDHAWQLHRSDMVEQLKLAHDELGIKSLRFHGIFDDDMWTISDLCTFSPCPAAERCGTGTSANADMYTTIC